MVTAQTRSSGNIMVTAQTRSCANVINFDSDSRQVSRFFFCERDWAI